MRVTLLSHFAGRGGSTSLLSQARSILQKAGHTTHIVVGTDDVLPEFSGCQICPPAHSWRDRMRSYRDIVLSTEPDLVYSISGGEEWEVLRFLALRRVRHVSSLESNDFVNIRRLMKALNTRLEAFTVNTPDVADDLREYVRGMQARSMVLPYAIDPLFTAQPPASAHPSARNIEICFVGRLESQLKRAHWLPDIVHGCARRGIDVSWHIYGDGSERSRLEGSLRDLSEGRTAVSFHGWASAETLAARLGGHDIFFLCSESEGMPIAMVEAMFCGLACLVPDIAGGMRYALKEGGGWLYRAKSPGDCVRAIAAAAGDRAGVERERTRARRSAGDLFGKERVDVQISQFCREIESLSFNGRCEDVNTARRIHPVPFFRRVIRKMKRTLFNNARGIA